jgi:hypothetical protein
MGHLDCRGVWISSSTWTMEKRNGGWLRHRNKISPDQQWIQGLLRSSSYHHDGWIHRAESNPFPTAKTGMATTSSSSVQIPYHQTNGDGTWMQN